jgi:hypothetical protein
LFCGVPSDLVPPSKKFLAENPAATALAQHIYSAPASTPKLF